MTYAVTNYKVQPMQGVTPAVVGLALSPDPSHKGAMQSTLAMRVFNAFGFGSAHVCRYIGMLVGKGLTPHTDADRWQVVLNVRSFNEDEYTLNQSQTICIGLGTTGGSDDIMGEVNAFAWKVAGGQGKPTAGMLLPIIIGIPSFPLAVKYGMAFEHALRVLCRISEAGVTPDGMDLALGFMKGRVDSKSMAAALLDEMPKSNAGPCIEDIKNADAQLGRVRVLTEEEQRAYAQVCSSTFEVTGLRIQYLLADVKLPLVPPFSPRGAVVCIQMLSHLMFPNFAVVEIPAMQGACILHNAVHAVVLRDQPGSSMLIPTIDPKLALLFMEYMAIAIYLGAEVTRTGTKTVSVNSVMFSGDADAIYTDTINPCMEGADILTSLASTGVKHVWHAVVIAACSLLPYSVFKEYVFRHDENKTTLLTLVKMSVAKSLFENAADDPAVVYGEELVLYRNVRIAASAVLKKLPARLRVACNAAMQQRDSINVDMGCTFDFGDDTLQHVFPHGHGAVSGKTTSAFRPVENAKATTERTSIAEYKDVVWKLAAKKEHVSEVKEKEQQADKFADLIKRNIGRGRGRRY